MDCAEKGEGGAVERDGWRQQIAGNEQSWTVTEQSRARKMHGGRGRQTRAELDGDETSKQKQIRRLTEQC